MDWRIVLVLVAVAIVLIGFIILGVLLQRARNRQAELRAEAEKWKGKYNSAKEEVKRLLDQKSNGELSDEEAIDKANDLLADWNAIDDDSSPGES